MLRPIELLIENTESRPQRHVYGAIYSAAYSGLWSTMVYVLQWSIALITERSSIFNCDAR
jgi:hypothetical protein